MTPQRFVDKLVREDHQTAGRFERWFLKKMYLFEISQSFDLMNIIRKIPDPEEKDEFWSPSKQKGQ